MKVCLRDKCLQLFYSLIQVMFSRVRRLPSSLSDSILEVTVTGDQMKHTVPLYKIIYYT